jgi:diguanylate cyclase (GGDEF)-like protein
MRKECWMFMGWDLSRTGRARVIFLTMVGIVGAWAVAFIARVYTTPFMTDTVFNVTLAAAIILPMVVAGPVFYIFSSKLRELALAHRELALAHYELSRIASQDSLTTCLNRGAFVTLVDAYLSQVNSARPPCGGLLVVDADHFKDINDRFGHQAGDEALRKIAAVIKGSLRDTDLVGRVGGEEFAVFLPQANLPHAEDIAERIRGGVSSIGFWPSGQPQPLSVSVGGATFRSAISFEELFAAADARLYEAKKRGRNRSEFTEWNSAAA